jgi:hypothetical protein
MRRTGISLRGEDSGKSAEPLFWEEESGTSSVLFAGFKSSVVSDLARGDSAPALVLGTSDDFPGLRGGTTFDVRLGDFGDRGEVVSLGDFGDDWTSIADCFGDFGVLGEGSSSSP